MPDSREERLARNEASFRALNEEIRSSVHDKLQGPHSDFAGFVCECGDPGCTELVRLPVSRYEQIRSDSFLFLIAAGHEIPDIEDVVDSGEGFAVVRKHDEFAEIVAESDPRA